MKRLILALFCLNASLVHAAPPQEIHATYKLLRNGQQIAVVTEDFKQDGKQYQLQSETAAVGVFALFKKGKITLTSTGSVTAGGLRPTHFEHHRGPDPAQTITADLDWDQLTVTHKFDGQTETATLKPGIQDRISFLYQFMFKPPRKGEVLISTTNGKKLNTYLYQMTGEEKAVTPAGQYRALHLNKPRTPDEDGTEIWLAKSLNNFPVRIVFDERDGGRMEQVLSSISFGQGKTH